MSLEEILAQPLARRSPLCFGLQVAEPGKCHVSYEPARIEEADGQDGAGEGLVVGDEGGIALGLKGEGADGGDGELGRGPGEVVGRLRFCDVDGEGDMDAGHAQAEGETGADGPQVVGKAPDAGANGAPFGPLCRAGEYLPQMLGRGLHQDGGGHVEGEEAGSFLAGAGVGLVYHAILNRPRGMLCSFYDRTCWQGTTEGTLGVGGRAPMFVVIGARGFGCRTDTILMS